MIVSTSHVFAVACLLSLSACISTARTTTEEERQAALATITTIESALTILHATGNIDDPERVKLALTQLSEIRKAVEESAEKPVSWTDIMQRISNIALQWAVVL